MIPIDQCEEGYLYRIRARNITLGVYKITRHPGFVGIRTKFGNRFLDTEYHYDANPHYGTATPLEKLEACPVANLRTNLDLQCEKCRIPMVPDPDPDRPGLLRGHAHIEPTECTERWGVLGFNRPLFDYLDEALRRFGPEE